jgi:acetyl esterase/lipase
LPVVLYIHGGGWVIADIDVYDSSPRALATATKAIVISTEYRHAPEAKFPAAHDDTWAAWLWTLSHAAAIGGDPKRIAIAGESAGGNMAAAIALRARDQNVQGPVAQLLVYPVADGVVNSPSERANTMTKPLNSPMLTWFYNQYLNSPADASNPYFNLLSADLHGVAPVTLITANIDPLNSEGMALVQRYKNAGVMVQTRDYPGVTHEFFGMGAVVDKAKDAVMFGAAGLRQGLDAAPR